MSRIYSIGIIGSRERLIEDGDTPQDACRKAKLDPWDCDVRDITDDIIYLEDVGDLEILSGISFRKAYGS